MARAVLLFAGMDRGTGKATRAGCNQRWCGSLAFCSPALFWHRDGPDSRATSEAHAPWVACGMSSLWEQVDWANGWRTTWTSIRSWAGRFAVYWMTGSCQEKA